MTIAAIFCIGTGHDHSEDANVLVKLHSACTLRDLGVEGNHTKDKTDTARISTTSIPTASNGGWTWLNEGQNNISGGMKAQSSANADLVEALPSLPEHVILVGHSRGAICCLRIAAELQKRLKGKSPKCHIFLYDPVKRQRQGTDWYNRTIHANVQNLKIIAMEDEDKMELNVKAFKLMAVKRGANGIEIDEGNYLRLPGTHGTATQVMGFPIGQVGYMLAIEFLNSLGGAKVPNAAAMDLSNEAFCLQYYKINGVNPIINGKRMVNDVIGKNVTSMTPTSSKPHTLGNRNEVLNKLAGVNPYQGSGFFINRDHASRFCAAYPALGPHLTGAGVLDTAPVKRDLKKLKMRDPNCYKAAKKLAAL